MKIYLKTTSNLLQRMKLIDDFNEQIVKHRNSRIKDMFDEFIHTLVIHHGLHRDTLLEDVPVVCPDTMGRGLKPGYLNEQLIELIEDDFSRHYNTMLDEFANTVSRKYNKPIEGLLQYAPRTESIMICMGTKSNGSRCGFMGIHDGYCKHHIEQSKRVRRRAAVSSDKLHMHPGQYDKNCPNCRNKFSLGLIDLSSIICNE